MSVYSRTLRYFRPFMWPTIWATLAMLLAVGLNLLAAWPVTYLIDGVLLPGESNLHLLVRSQHDHAVAGLPARPEGRWLLANFA